MLGDGLAVIGGGIALFPWQRPLGLLILQHTGDVNTAFAEPLATGQTALLIHCNWGVLWDQGEDRRTLWSPKAMGPCLLFQAQITLLPRCERRYLFQKECGRLPPASKWVGDPVGSWVAV